MNPLLFLDFDGVLHPTSAVRDGYFVRVALLEDALDGSNCELIISSSWRHHHDPAELAEMFPTGLRGRLAACTGDPCFGRWPRYQEIRAYLRTRPGQRSWRALDDSINEFPPGCRELIACDPNVGLASSGVAELRRWLRLD